MSQLDEFLDSIDPSRTIDVVRARADESMNRFEAENGAADSWEDYRQTLARLYCQLEHDLLNRRTMREVDFDMDWGRCIHLLSQAYGPNGEQKAYEYAHTGMEGGLYGVLKSVASGLADQYATTEIDARASEFFQEISTDKIFEVAEEYVEKHGNLLPPEYAESNAVSVKMNLMRVLTQHPWSLDRVRRTGR